jgi:hypothetical protein
MMHAFVPPDEYPEVAEHARLMLNKAAVGDRLPTPVNDVVACAELVVNRDVTLSEEHTGLLARSLGVLRSALSKVHGIVDLRDNQVYLAPGMLPQKRAFLQLHETGHKVLPWQRETYLYLDDEKTLDPSIRIMFEREANAFASHMLFQLDRFDRDALDLPLEWRSLEQLAKRYKASLHATVRRYVERTPRSCAVLVLERIPDLDGPEPRVKVRQALHSRAFARHFGAPRWAEYIGLDVPFTLPILRGCRFLEDHELTLVDRAGTSVECGFHLLDSSYYIFVLVFPLSERIGGGSRAFARR